MKLNNLLEKHRAITSKKLLLSGVIILLLLIAVIYSITVGPSSITTRELWQTVRGQDTGHIRNIIWNIRLPRITTAILAGMGLSMAGVIMQSILRNPLGSPFTLGISQAAAFGAAVSIMFFQGLRGGGLFSGVYLTTIMAFITSLSSTFFILLLSKYRNSSPEIMVLAGIALGSLFNAGTMALQYFADDVELASIVFWTFGDVGRTTWGEILMLVIILLLSLVYFIYNSWNYNSLHTGDETALSLGVDVNKVRLKGMLLASLLTSFIVSLVGIIGFVGLVTPHIIRMLIGGNEKYLIPATTLAGGLLLLVSDTTARTIIAPVVLPVGILTSFLGAPLFIYLILKGRKLT
ncbi:MAG: FecCD family ABC transporter permease [Bacillota bacterium]